MGRARLHLGALLGLLVGGHCGAAPAALVPGDSSPSYVLPETGETLSYRRFVPAANGSPSYGLVVLLHGFGGTKDSPFDQPPAALEGVVQREAERHHFIVVAPAGYKGHGDYGAHLALPPHPGHDIVHPAREDDLALADTLHVVRELLRTLPIDRKRVFLMGNSMGMTGTLNLAQAYPRSWCAIAPSDGPPWPHYPVERLRPLKGAIFVNGAKDQLATSAVNRELADRLRAAGVDTQFLEVPEGEHGTAWYFAVPAIFDFFAAHTCKSDSVSP